MTHSVEKHLRVLNKHCFPNLSFISDCIINELIDICYKFTMIKLFWCILKKINFSIFADKLEHCKIRKKFLLLRPSLTARIRKEVKTGYGRI